MTESKREFLEELEINYGMELPFMYKGGGEM